MKKLSQPLRSLSVCHINQEQNLWLLKTYDGAFSKKKSTIRQVATNTGRIAAGNPESPLPVDGLEQRQNNKPRATIPAALWMVDGPRRMGTCHDKPATSSLSDTSTSTVWMLQRKIFHEPLPVPQGWFKLHRPLDNGDTCDNDAQEEDVLYSDEEDSSDNEMYIHEWATWQSLTVFITDNHAKIFFWEV